MRAHPVALDGPAASGKTTVGKLLAKRLNRYFLDTGLMYRLVAVRMLERFDGKVSEELTRWKEVMNDITEEDYEALLFAPEDQDEDWRSRVKHLLEPEVSKVASLIATIPELRDRLNAVQRMLAERFPLVVVGRDSTTVVFRDSPYRFFLTASLRERAMRRFKQLREMGVEVSLEEVEAELRERDTRDSTRDVAPLRLEEGVIEVNTDGLSPEEVVERIVRYIEELEENYRSKVHELKGYKEG